MSPAPADTARYAPAAMGALAGALVGAFDALQAQASVIAPAPGVYVGGALVGAVLLGALGALLGALGWAKAPRSVARSAGSALVVVFLVLAGLDAGLDRGQLGARPAALPVSESQPDFLWILPAHLSDASAPESLRGAEDSMLHALEAWSTSPDRNRFLATATTGRLVTGPGDAPLPAEGTLRLSQLLGHAGYQVGVVTPVDGPASRAFAWGAHRAAAPEQGGALGLRGAPARLSLAWWARPQPATLESTSQAAQEVWHSLDASAPPGPVGRAAGRGSCGGRPGDLRAGLGAGSARAPPRVGRHRAPRRPRGPGLLPRQRPRPCGASTGALRPAVST